MSEEGTFPNARAHANSQSSGVMVSDAARHIVCRVQTMGTVQTRRERATMLFCPLTYPIAFNSSALAVSLTSPNSQLCRAAWDWLDIQFSTDRRPTA